MGIFFAGIGVVSLSFFFFPLAFVHFLPFVIYDLHYAFLFSSPVSFVLFLFLFLFFGVAFVWFCVHVYGKFTKKKKKTRKKKKEKKGVSSPEQCRGCCSLDA